MTADQDQWHPSDIVGDTETESDTIKRRGRPPSDVRQKLELRGDKEARPTLQGDTETPSAKLHTAIPSEPAQIVQDGNGSGLSVCEEVEQRLRETSRKCIECYNSFHAGSGDELDLTNSLHELRRVLARIEIEVAARHTDDSMQRTIPIPMHRSHQRGV